MASYKLDTNFYPWLMLAMSQSKLYVSVLISTTFHSMTSDFGTKDSPLKYIFPKLSCTILYVYNHKWILKTVGLTPSC